MFHSALHHMVLDMPYICRMAAVGITRRLIGMHDVHLDDGAAQRLRYPATIPDIRRSAFGRHGIDAST